MSEPKRGLTIEQIEAELRESRTQAWDVEAFLAKRHQAKFKALTDKQSSPRKRRWVIAKEAAWSVAGFVGTVSILNAAGYWLLTGRLFLPPFFTG